MAKHSKNTQRRIAQAGLGDALRVVHRMPRFANRLPNAPELDAEMEFRLRCIEHAQTHGVAAAVAAFKRSRATVYRWLKRYDPTDLRSLRPFSRRPNQTRTRQWTAKQEQAVRDLRQQHPREGKAKLCYRLRQAGERLSESMIGRMLASLKRRKLLIEPHAVRERKRRPVRPYATRVPTDKRQPTEPGQLIQLDTMHLRPLPTVERRQFTAIDVVSRCAVLGVRASATAGTATAFLDELQDRMPVPVQAIQVDGGSEFMAGFETACEQRGIALYVLPPRSPKLNGRVERLNGTVRREFWECYGGDLDLPTLQQALQDFETEYNEDRPHQALDYRSPRQHLTSLSVSHVSN